MKIINNLNNVPNKQNYTWKETSTNAEAFLQSKRTSKSKFYVWLSDAMQKVLFLSCKLDVNLTEHTNEDKSKDVICNSKSGSSNRLFLNL